MKNLVAPLAIGAMSLLPAFGQYVFFQDDFESVAPAGPNVEPIPLLGNGMVVGANIFSSANAYITGYFGFDAPNIAGDGARFCNVAGEQGGPDQGAQVLSVFSDYNNSAAQTAGGETTPGSGVYTGGQLVDANVYVEFVVEAADLGTTVTFAFDSKMGDFQAGPVAGSDPVFNAEAEAFVKVLKSSDFSYSELVADKMDMAGTPVTWGTYSVSIVIDPAWEGELLQAGFRNKTSNYAPSGVFYDNISLTSDRAEPVDRGPKILSTSWENNEFTVSFEGKEGFDYTLYKGASIEGPYDELIEVISGSGSEDSLSDLSATDPSGFYRIDEQPTP